MTPPWRRRGPEQWTSRWLSAPDKTGKVDVDLRDGAARSVHSLLLAIAVAAERCREDAPVQLRLPGDAVELDRLRRWDFQSVCELATGRSLLGLVGVPDRALFGEVSEPLPPVAVAAGLADFRSELERDSFFGLTAYVLDEPGALTRMIRSEWERWRHPLVARLLRAHPPEVAGDVARVLVHELLANVIQHPRATIAVIGSSVDAGPDGNDRLVISVWDDGASVIDTLAAVPVDQLRAPGPKGRTAEITDGFHVDARGWKPAEAVVSAGWTPPDPPEPGDLLLAALLPGISRKHINDDYPAVDRPEPVAWEAHTGFGLHALYRCSVNAFGGSVSVRTADHWLRLRGPTDAEGGAARYRAEIDRLDHELFGNLISVELPLRVARPR